MLNIHHRFSDIMVLIFVINDIEVSTIITKWILVLIGLDGNTIATVWLSSRFVPNKIILAIHKTPRWN